MNLAQLFSFINSFDSGSGMGMPQPQGFAPAQRVNPHAHNPSHFNPYARLVPSQIEDRRGQFIPPHQDPYALYDLINFISNGGQNGQTRRAPSIRHQAPPDIGFTPF